MLLTALIITVGCSAACVVSYASGRTMRKWRIADLRTAAYDAGWDDCVDAWRAWEARQEQAQRQVTYEPPPQIEHVRETVLLEPITVVLPVIDRREPVAGEPTEAEVAASRAAHGYIPELADYVSAPQPALAVAPGDEWEDDSLGLLRASGAFPEPSSTLSGVLQAAHDEAPRETVPPPAQAACQEPGTTVADILEWGAEMRSTLTWRDEDWATTMPWEREGADDRMLVTV